MLLKKVLSVTAFLVWAVPAAAQTPVEQVIAALEAKGYAVIVQERTWLGRMRIVAVNDQMRRELVINPGTGEILRDYAELLWKDSEGSEKNGGSQVASTATEIPVVRTANEPVLGTAVAIEAPQVSGEAPLVLADPIVVEGN